MLRKRWRSLKMFLCFKMLTKSLKILWTIIGKKTVSEILYATGRNFLSKKETSCHRKKSLVRTKGRHLLWQEETFWHCKKPPITGRISCHTKKHLMMSQEETYCHKKKAPVVGRNFLSQEEASWHNKKPFITGRNFPFKDWHTNGWTQCWGRNRDCWKCSFASKYLHNLYEFYEPLLIDCWRRDLSLVLWILN
jgi:hypothetical protein